MKHPYSTTGWILILAVTLILLALTFLAAQRDARGQVIPRQIPEQGSVTQFNSDGTHVTTNFWDHGQTSLTIDPDGNTTWTTTTPTYYRNFRHLPRTPLDRVLDGADRDD